jgi:hypothetical protein
MALFVNQQVLRLQVTIGNVQGMDVLDGTCDFCHVEKSHIVDEPAFRSEESEQLAASNILE